MLLIEKLIKTDSNIHKLKFSQLPDELFQNCGNNMETSSVNALVVLLMIILYVCVKILILCLNTRVSVNPCVKIFIAMSDKKLS